ncbi:MAG: hypothetical protein LUE64_01110 [Candidatus Gastranaerophilales bacterium]|nr:hypothetical protein [Candidatus Gastranaerophilales bacterium]
MARVMSVSARVNAAFAWGLHVVFARIRAVFALRVCGVWDKVNAGKNFEPNFLALSK